MSKVLFPFDGSDCARRALGQFVRRAIRSPRTDVLLLNVQPDVPVRKLLIDGRLSTVRRLRQPLRAQGLKLLAQAERVLANAGIPCTLHVEFGDPALAIARFARSLYCDQIVMGTRGLGGVPKMLLGSVATKVLHLSAVPVTLVK